MAAPTAGWDRISFRMRSRSRALGSSSDPQVSFGPPAADIIRPGAGRRRRTIRDPTTHARSGDRRPSRRPTTCVGPSRCRTPVADPSTRSRICELIPSHATTRSTTSVLPSSRITWTSSCLWSSDVTVRSRRRSAPGRSARAGRAVPCGRSSPSDRPRR